MMTNGMNPGCGCCGSPAPTSCPHKLVWAEPCTTGFTNAHGAIGPFFKIKSLVRGDGTAVQVANNTANFAPGTGKFVATLTGNLTYVTYGDDGITTIQDPGCSGNDLTLTPPSIVRVNAVQFSFVSVRTTPANANGFTSPPFDSFVCTLTVGTDVFTISGTDQRVNVLTASFVGSVTGGTAKFVNHYPAGPGYPEGYYTTYYRFCVVLCWGQKQNGVDGTGYLPDNYPNSATQNCPAGKSPPPLDVT